MRDYDIGQAQCAPSNNYGQRDLTFCTDSPPQYIVPLKESKQKSNEVGARNRSRDELFQSHIGLIQIVEACREHLTASDKKEFKEMFQNLINEI